MQSITGNGSKVVAFGKPSASGSIAQAVVANASFGTASMRVAA